MKCGNCGGGHFYIDSAKKFIVEVSCAQCGFVMESVRDLYDGMIKDGANYPPLRRFELFVSNRE